jgi:hypothetical protein
MTSDTATDNIEDYAEQAEASKVAAAASETAAASSATASASSASGSSTSAAEALASKNASAVSEANAAASAATAATQASNSSTSATASETSRVASVAAQAAAETAETAAETAQTAAEAAEAGVAADAATATAQAAIATTQATNSGTSATASEASRVAAVAAQAAAETAETNAETAETNAETAQVAAEAAETSASGFSTSASTSAATATAQAGIATTKAGEAAASATASASSATASEAAKDAALSALDNFQDQYLGDFASDPTTDNDGDPLQAGMLYFNTTDDVMKVYTGSAWVAAYASLSGALLTTNNLSDLNNAATARTNLGLGTAATTASTDYATAAQGTLADSAVQPNDSPVFGSVTVTGTVDGRDVAADGTKLDGIEAGATADQTKADIDALGIAASTASALATARNIAVTGAVTGNANFDGSGNISISTTATSDPTVTLTGAVTGSGTMTNLGNVSIATTATADPTLTLSGDASGSATFTNLGNATLSVTVADDSHNHVISNVDGLQTALDGKLSTSGKAADSDLLDGYNSNQSESGNTVAVRNSSGYLFSSYFNGSGTFSTTGATSGMARFTGTNGSDTYGRSYTAAAARALLNVADGATNVTNNNQLTNGAGYTTNVGDITGVTAGTNLTGGGTSGSVTLNVSSSPSFTGVISGQGDVAIGGGSGYGYFKGYDLNWNHFIGSRMRVSGSTASPTISGAHDLTFVEYLSADSDGFKFKSSSTGSYVDVAHITRNGMFLYDGSLREDYDALSGTSPTCNVNNGGAFSLSMSGNTTFTFSGATSGMSSGFILQLTGNGSTVTWPSSVDWAGGTAPDAPASGASNLYVFYTRDGGSNWIGVLSSAAYA